MKESQTDWGRSIGWLGLGGMIGSIVWVGLVPGQLSDELAAERTESLTQGLQAAPAPNMPGRLDGNSVGNANNERRKEVVDKWSLLGDQIKSGSISRIPGESEIEHAPPSDVPPGLEDTQP